MIARYRKQLTMNDSCSAKDRNCTRKIVLEKSSKFSNDVFIWQAFTSDNLVEYIGNSFIESKLAGTIQTALRLHFQLTTAATKFSFVPLK